MVFFPTCPAMSCFVPVCPLLSLFVPICPRSGPQEGQKRTRGDKMGASTPHLAFLDHCFTYFSRISGMGLEAQQRYLSCLAILAAIVSQSSSVLVFMGYRTIIARYVAKWGIAQMCLCETKYQGGYRTIFGKR